MGVPFNILHFISFGLQEKFKREFLRRCPFCRFGRDASSMADFNNESKSMYTRATSIRSNFANASLRHNHHHIHQNYNNINNGHNQTLVVAGPGQLNNNNNNYYNFMNSNTNNNNHNHNNNSLTVGHAMNGGGKRFSSGDLELKPISMKDSSNRKIVFQPVRTASLKNNHSAQNGPLLTGITPATGITGHKNSSGSNDVLYPPDMDLCDAPLLTRIGEVAEVVSNGGGGKLLPVNPIHSCRPSGVCLNENCPSIMFEDVDL